MTCLFFGAIAEFPICASTAPAFDDSAFTELINSPSIEGIFILNVKARDILRLPALDVPLEPLASYPICAEYLDDAFSAVLQDLDLWFSDRVYSTSPQDTVFPNLAPRASLVQAMDFSQTIPAVPNSGTRSQISTGIAKINNANGELNSIIESSTIRNRTITLRFGPLYDEVRDVTGALVTKRYADLGLGIELAQYVGSDWSADRGEVSIHTRNVREVLNGFIHQSYYLGTGAEEGDFELTGSAKPVMFGDCFNVTPILINRAFLVYQIHFSRVQAINVVRDMGTVLPYAGDYPSFNALALAPLAPGEWASCLAEGMFRLGAAAAGIVTCDALGAVFASGYYQDAGELLFFVAVEYGRVSSTDLEAPSILGLPTGAMGRYYDGSEPDARVANFYDDILSSLNGWFGLSRQRKVRAGLNVDPSTAPINYTVQSYQIQADGLTREESTDVTRASQSLRYKKNWTPLTDDQIALGVSPAERLLLKSDGQIVQRASSIARIIDESAEDFGPIDTYISDATLAGSIAQRIIDVEEIPRQRWRLKMPRSAILWVEGQTVEVFTSLYGFDGGKRFVITGVNGRISQRKLEMEFELRG